MIDFPIAELLADRIGLMWLERPRHPDGLQCRPCGRTSRRLFRHQGHVPADRCRVCDGDSTLLPGPVFENTRQRPATLVLLLRGLATGEPDRTLGLRAGSVTPATAYRAPAGAGEPAPHRADSAEDRHDVGGG